MAITKSFADGNNAGASATTIASGSINSTGFTHAVCFIKHEGATTTIAVTDNKGSGTYNALTKQPNRVNDSWGQIHWKKLGTPGTSTTLTATFGAARTFRTIITWLITADSSEITMESEATAMATPGDTAAADAGTLTTTAASVMFQGVAEYTGVTYTQGTGWTEDYDPNGTPANYTYGQSRAEAAGGTFDPVATANASQTWATCAAAFIEAGADVTTGATGSASTSAAGTSVPGISLSLKDYIRGAGRLLVPSRKIFLPRMA